MATDKALDIEPIRENILKHVSNLEDLKNMSLLNSTWNSQANKYFEEDSYCALLNDQIGPFVDNLEQNGWSKKNILVCFWFDCYDGPNCTNPDGGGNVEEDIEKMRKIGPYLKSLSVIVGEDTTGEQFFKILTISKDTEILFINFEREFITQIADLTKLVQANPLSFPNLKKLVIANYISADVWDFCKQFLIPLIPLSCKSLHIYRNEQHSIRPIISKLLQIPGKLEQFEEICVNRLDNEDWGLLTATDFPRLRSMALYLEGNFLERVTKFFAKYANQLTKLEIVGEVTFPGEQEFMIPKMANLRELKLVMDRKKPKLMGECAYPKLKKMIAEYTFYDKEGFLEYFSDVSTRGGLSQQLTTVIPRLRFGRDEDFPKWHKSELEAKFMEEVEKLFPNAKVSIDYDELKFRKKNY